MFEEHTVHVVGWVCQFLTKQTCLLFHFCAAMSQMLMAAFVTSVSAVSKIVLICAGGAYLQKAGILNKEHLREGHYRIKDLTPQPYRLV